MTYQNFLEVYLLLVGTVKKYNEHRNKSNKKEFEYYAGMISGILKMCMLSGIAVCMRMNPYHTYIYDSMDISYKCHHKYYRWG